MRDYPWSMSPFIKVRNKIYNIIIVRYIQERIEKYKTEARERFSSSLASKLKRFNLGREKCLEKEEKDREKKAENAFKKYKGFYFQMKRIKEQLLEKQKTQNSKLVEKAERLQEIEKENDKKRKQIIKKIENMQKKKEKLDEKKEEIFMKKKEERDKLFEAIKEHQENNKEERNDFREEILEAQRNKLERAINKCYGYDFKKMKSQRDTVKSQMLFEEDLKTYFKELNNLISENVMKKNESEKRLIYLDKLRAEREKKKKEQEAKLEKIGAA